jgi:glycosyltransferase involved in cell wall biosynthesis
MATRLSMLGVKVVLFTPLSSYIKLKLYRCKFAYKMIPLPPKIHFVLTNSSILTKLYICYFNIFQNLYNFQCWHVTTGYPVGVLASMSLTPKGIPFFIQCVGIDIQKDESLNYGYRLDIRVDNLFRQWVPKASLLLAISDAVVHEYQALNIPKEKFYLLPRGVDCSRFINLRINRSSLRKKYNFSNKIVYLTVGRYHKKKNFEGLLQTYMKLPKKVFNDSLLVFCGQGIRKNFEKNNITFDSDSVIFIEPSTSLDFNMPQDEIVELMIAADVFTFPSFIETFGIVLIEAMAAGLPVITSNRSGCNFVAQNGKYARLINPSELHTLEDAMIEFFYSYNIRENYSKLSIERASEFDWDIVTNQLHKLLIKYS